MQEITPKAGKNKTGKRPYMRLFTSDYRDGTLHLSFELQGFYFRILTYLHDGENVPADPDALARFIHCNVRTSRALLPKLIAVGKLYVDGDWIRNKRVDRDLNLISDRDEPDINPISNPYQPDITPISVREIEKTESNQEAENTTIERTTSTAISISKDSEQVAAAELEPVRAEPSVAALPASPPNLSDLHDRLVSACNGSLDNPVNCMGLLSLATPQMWIERGADLDRDIIPTLQAYGKKYHGKRIRDWNYFTPMVAEAVEKRTAALPKASAGYAPKESARARRAKIFEKLQQEGRA